MSKVRYFRKVIRITAEDSPNCRWARAEIAQGREPSNTIIFPGVLPWADYRKRRATWDKIRQCVSLDARFYEGAELLLFPPHKLNNSEAQERFLPKKRRARGIGVDPAEGGDKSVWCVGDEFGVLDVLSLETPDTSVIPNTTIALMNQWGVPPERVCFDRGGGGKQHADRLKELGYEVRSVGFGERPTLPIMPGAKLWDERKEESEEKYVYMNLRAEMYHRASLRIDTPPDVRPYCVPRRFDELRRQLAPIPRMYDGEGRIYLPPKHRKPNQPKTTVCLSDMIGCSPDEADAFVLMLYSMDNDPELVTAGALF